MHRAATHTPVTKRDWLIPAGLTVLSLVPALAGAARLAELGSGAVTPANARFVATPLPVVLHIVFAMLYSLGGAWQFAPGFRRRHRRLHRTLGAVLIPSGLVVALTGLWMAHFYPWPAQDGVAVYLERLIFGTAMVLSIFLGIDAIRRRNFAAHGDWMIRAYAIGLGAGTQVFTHLPYFMLVGQPDVTPRAIMMGAGWVINVIVAEWVIRRSAKEAPRKRAALEPWPA